MPADKTEQKVLRFISDNKLIKKNDNILIALSGGADSVFLLKFLSKYSRKFGITLHAAHLNHSLRGEESDGDENFCKNLCSKENIPFFSRKADIKKSAETLKLSVEEAAREIRYKFLQETAKETGSNLITTAHNSDDNTETVLYNLFRGTGLAGMTGIPVKRDNIIRPVLNIPKAEIIVFLTERDIPFRVDSSNLSEDYTRNYIRNNLLPSVRENINPAADNNINKFASVAGEALSFINAETVTALKEYTKYENNEFVISTRINEEKGNFLFAEVIKKGVEDYFGESFSHDDYMNLLRLNNNLTGKHSVLSGGLAAYRERGEIIIANIIDESNYEYKITLGKEYYFPEQALTIKIEMIKGEISGFSHEYELISANNIDDIFILRNWKNGDKFIPLGMKGFKKVSDFLNESGIESRRKKRFPVLLNRNNIVSVVGLRIDDRFKVQKNDNMYCKIWIKKDDH